MIRDIIIGLILLYILYAELLYHINITWVKKYKRNIGIRVTWWYTPYYGKDIITILWKK